MAGAHTQCPHKESFVNFIYVPGQGQKLQYSCFHGFEVHMKTAFKKKTNIKQFELHRFFSYSME